MVTEEARFDCPEQSTNREAVFQIVLTITTTITTTDEEVCMRHMVDQDSQYHFRSLYDEDLRVE